MGGCFDGSYHTKNGITKKEKQDWKLDFLLRPRSVALIGCSQNFSSLSGRPLKFLLERNYPGKIYPVNPRYDKIQGLQCYSSIEAVPEPVDVALLLVPAKKTESELERCMRSSSRSVIITSSGFIQMGEEGRRIQEKIRAISHAAGMPVLGPNCLGIINLVDSIPLSFTTALDEEIFHAGKLAGKLSLISQSGAIAAYILCTGQEAQIGFSYWISTGDEASLEVSAIAQYLLPKKEVNGLLLYLEEARDPQGLMRAGDLARDLGKPIICLKVGRSVSGKRAALSHTGSLAGLDEEYDAAFKRAGIVRARDIANLLDLGVVLSNSWKPKSKRVAIASISGGGAVICADRCEEVGLEVPEFDAQTLSSLIKILPAFGAAQNPVDITGEMATSPGLLKKILEVILSDSLTDLVLIFLGGNRTSAQTISESIVEVFKENRRIKGKPIIVVWMAAPQQVVETLRKAEVPLLFDAVRAVNCITQLLNKPEIRDSGSTAVSCTSLIPSEKEIRTMLSSVISSKASDQALILGEYDCKKLLAKLGILSPRGGTAESVSAAIKLAEEIGFPVVAKIDSPDIIHKSDIDAVKVGIRTPGEMFNTLDEMLRNLKHHHAEAKIRGILVEEMVSDALETIVGLKWSDNFGPLIMFGMGGVFVHLAEDFSLRIAPVKEEEAFEMINELKAVKVFSGLRGFAPRDLNATVRAISLVSHLGAALGKDLLEFDINPLFVLKDGSGVKVGDALMVLKGSAFNS
jgi:acetyltransferase